MLAKKLAKIMFPLFQVSCFMLILEIIFVLFVIPWQSVYFVSLAKVWRILFGKLSLISNIFKSYTALAPDYLQVK
jgi:hypothetical protein